MFEALARVPEDPLLAVSTAFRADPSADKIDLGVGVYRDDSGNTPVPAAVQEAERQLLAAQTSKTYLSPIGNPGFNQRLTSLVLGAVGASRGAQAIGVQGPGGSGALRLGAELLRLARPDTRLLVSKPTWANHIPLLGGAGLAIDSYPYYEIHTHGVDFDAMLAQLEQQPAGNTIVLHACCHNPTGADLTLSQWEALTEIIKRRELLPFIDLAYQGLADDLETDVAGLRLMCALVPEALIAVSCSKNFGLYRERTGLLIVLTPSGERSSIVAAQLGRVARTLYSMPPDHGAAIVERVLSDSTLLGGWKRELATMTQRINGLRAALADALTEATQLDYSWIMSQRGMFSKLDLSADSVRALRDQHHVFTAPDGRLNIAGLRTTTVERVAHAIAAVSRDAN